MISVITWLAYRRDKASAREGAWRARESTLHLLDLAGGWPGAFFAQRKRRHKTAKGSILIVFWAMVSLHQIVAFDCLSGARIAKAFVTAIDPVAAHDGRGTECSPSSDRGITPIE